ncbi:MAG TPA: TlpA disulfide reductase family protein [Planctomycetota bacterium]|nr:TlpA disulfide reductase family protein [Planctomycetota bacterium]
MKSSLVAAALIAFSVFQPPSTWAEHPAVLETPKADGRTGAPEAITDEELRKFSRSAKGMAAPFSLMATSLPLVAAFGGSPDKPDFRAEVKALRAAFQRAEQAYRRLVREAKSDEERRRIERDPGANPVPGYLVKFRELADRARGTEGGADALIEILRLARHAPDGRAAGDAVQRLVKEHLASPSMERLANLLGNGTGATLGEVRRRALEAIQDRSTLAKPKAAALFILAVEEMTRDEAASRAMLNRLTHEFGETQYAAMADRTLFELDHLQVGRIAPDFEATDEKGQAYKLSDYRGKVTVIDFWGSWCGSCRGELSLRKQLVERLRDKPFAIIGVNSDYRGDLGKINPMLKEQGISWRQAIDGTTSGPIATRWNVQSRPTIYVLDEKGVIRFKNARGERLGKVVDELLAEMGIRKVV